MKAANDAGRVRKELSVGEVAARSGVAVSAIHFYEAKGLIRSRRNQGNQRRYARGILRLVAVIKVAQRIGMPLATIRDALATIPVLCAGGPGAGRIGAMSERERFHWLVAPKSTIVQTSPVHTGRCADAEGALEHLMNTMVRR